MQNFEIEKRHGIRVHQGFDTDSLERIRCGVDALNPLWKQRKADWPLFTLGFSLYQDAKAVGFTEYSRLAESIAPVIDTQLNWLYEEFLVILRKILKADARYHPKLARPGFHIMTADRRFTENFAGIHIDTQYTLIEQDKIDLQMPQVFDDSTILTVTLPICLPATGGGMNIWNISKNEADSLERKEVANRLAPEFMAAIDYQVGLLYMHSGLRFHQIAPWRSFSDDDLRITLQAHGIKHDDCWTIFW